MDPAITTALNLLYEAFKALHKDDVEKFEKEWKKDEQDFLEAIKNHDSATLAMLISKYSGLL
jgi:ferric iron reductase protein FhuF